jgi:uncharacterized protein (DUF952 family)
MAEGRRIFHLTTGPEWREAEARGSYEAPSLTEVGFIHFSNAEQVARTARERFGGTPDLVVLTVAVEDLGGVRLVDEPGDPGSPELFPHLYGALPTSAVRSVDPYEVP